jgi:hypothetical protein
MDGGHRELTTAEAALILGVTPGRVLARMRQGHLEPCRQVGRMWLFLRRDVLAILRRMDAPGARRGWEPVPAGSGSRRKTSDKMQNPTCQTVTSTL